MIPDETFCSRSSVLAPNPLWRFDSSEEKKNARNPRVAVYRLFHATWTKCRLRLGGGRKKISRDKSRVRFVFYRQNFRSLIYERKQGEDVEGCGTTRSQDFIRTFDKEVNRISKRMHSLQSSHEKLRIDHFHRSYTLWVGCHLILPREIFSNENTRAQSIKFSTGNYELITSIALRAFGLDSV